MKPSFIYRQKSIRVSSNLYYLDGFLPEMKVEEEAELLNTRIEIRLHFHKDLGVGLHLAISSVWFDSKPVMIIRNAGRNGEERDRFVIDSHLYHDMLSFILSLKMKFISLLELEDYVNPDTDVDALNRWQEYTDRFAVE